MNMNAIDALTRIAVSNNPEWVSIKYLNSSIPFRQNVYQQNRLQIIDSVAKRALEELEACGNEEKSRCANEILQSLSLLKQSHFRQTHLSGITLLCKKIWWRLWGSAYFKEKIKTHQENEDFQGALSTDIEKVRQFAKDNQIRLNRPLGSHSEALLRFTIEFERHLAAAPPDMDGGEIDMLFLVSERIWNSKQVQNEREAPKRHDKYKDLMIEYAIGSHMIFFEDPNFEVRSLCQTAIEQIGKRDERGSVRDRVSTHYGAVGSETQFHIEGSRFPELLFKEGSIPIDINQGNKIVFEDGKLRYWRDCSEDLQLKPQMVGQRVTWLQNERTPDGPRRSDWLLHRYRDVPLYWALKNILKCKRCQVGPYISSIKGRGVPDTAPIVIEPAARSNEERG